MILGKNLILALNGTPLAAAKSCMLDAQQSFLDKASPTSGRWTEVIPERLSWTMSSDALIGTMAAYSTLLDAYTNGTALTMRLYDAGTLGLNKTGTVYVENIHLEGSVGALCKMSVSLRGSGPLSTYSGEPIPLTLIDTQNNYYIRINAGNAEFVREEGSLSTCSSFDLTERSNVRIDPKECMVIFTADYSVKQPFSDRYDFNLASYSCTVYTSPADLWLNAGTYTVIISNEDNGTLQEPVITKLS